MKTLGEQIRALRGNATLSEFAKRTTINRQTLTDLEDLKSVKLTTLRLIATKCGLGQREWINLLIGWVRAEIGEENYSLLNVSPATLPWASGRRPAPEALFVKIFSSLGEREQGQLLKAMIREPVRNCLPALNRAVERQRAESRRLLGAIFARRLLQNELRSPSDISSMIKELRERGLFEDVTDGADVLLEHELQANQEKLAEQLLPELSDSGRRSRERRYLLRAASK